MIRINLLKEEKKKFTLPDLSKLKEVNVKEALKSSAILVIPAVGLIVIAAELFYSFKLKGEIGVLEGEVNSLKAQRDMLKAKVRDFNRRKNELTAQIRELETRIKYLEQSKDVIKLLKELYDPFNGTVSFVYSSVPSTVWLNEMKQSMDFSKINLEISFGSYDIGSIKGFFENMKREFGRIVPGELVKNNTDLGIVFYTASVKAERETYKR